MDQTPRPFSPIVFPAGVTPPRLSHASMKLRAAELGDRLEGTVIPRILEVTTPIWEFDGVTAPESVGSGILLAIADRAFLVTAAHVLNRESKKPLAMACSDQVVPLPRTGIRVASVEAESGADNDIIDTAVLPIEGEISGFLRANEVASSEDLWATGHIVAGYPSSRQKRLLKGRTQGAELHFVLAKQAARKVYQAQQRTPETHLVLGYNKDLVSQRGFGEGVRLEGMSGCGMWALSGSARAPGVPRLAAVFTEIRKADSKVLVGTRLSVAMKAIADHFPELRPSLRLTGHA